LFILTERRSVILPKKRAKSTVSHLKKKEEDMQYNFDQVIERVDSDCMKWRRYPEDVIPLWVADMDFISPEPVIQALRERVEHGIFGYPGGAGLKMAGDTCLKEVVVERLARLYAWEVQPEDLVFLPGVVTGINMACHAFGRPGDAALVQTPVYSPFLTAPGNAGLALQEMELTRRDHGRYEINFDLFEQAITPQTRLFILCNPHNPVGRVYQQAELARMAEICLKQNVVICSDEIHCDLVFTGYKHIPIASLDSEIARQTITLMAPSKTFNIAGLQCSFAVIQNAQLRKQFQGGQQGLVSFVNLMGLTAALAAYRDGGEWLDQLMVYLQANRDFLIEYVQQEMPGIEVSPVEGTYLAWLDCRKVIQRNPYEFFLDEARVGLGDGKVFGKSGNGFVRVNFGCPRLILFAALERMKEAVSRAGLPPYKTVN
jgi:cysteine-S-conjugate beta-lyase